MAPCRCWSLIWMNLVKRMLQVLNLGTMGTLSKRKKIANSKQTLLKRRFLGEWACLWAVWHQDKYFPNWKKTEVFSPQYVIRSNEASLILNKWQVILSWKYWCETFLNSPGFHSLKRLLLEKHIFFFVCVCLVIGRTIKTKDQEPGFCSFKYKFVNGKKWYSLVFL